ncbi:MAG: hypothetical protein U0168_18995, partial [Nannocystaceae bacterium]
NQPVRWRQCRIGHRVHAPCGRTLAGGFLAPKFSGNVPSDDALRLGAAMGKGDQAAGRARSTKVAFARERTAPPFVQSSIRRSTSMNSENSALTALSELRNLEANRVASEEAERQAAVMAEQRARDEAERRAREEADRVARAQAEEFARQQAEQEAREREERIRIHEAEVRARADHDARLREEQMRLDAQMKLAEKKAKPKWPLVVVPLLVVGLGGIGFFAWRSHVRAEEERKAAAERDEQYRAEIASMNERFAVLEGEQERLEKDREELNGRLAAATTDAERAKIRAEMEENARKQAENEAALAAAEQTAEAEGVKREPKKKKGGGSGPGPSTSKPAAGSDDPPSTGRKEKIKLGGGDNPLDGL